MIVFRTVGIAASASATMLKMIARIAESVIAHNARAKPESPPQPQSRAPSLQYAVLVAYEAMKTRSGPSVMPRVIRVRRPTPSASSAAKITPGAIVHRAHDARLGRTCPEKIMAM